MEQLIVERRSEYVYFKLGSQPISLDEALSILPRLLLELREAKMNRMLFEKSGETRKLRIEDYYSMAETIGKEVKGLRMAILTSPVLHTPEVAFFELATSSAGNMLRYFNDLKSAEAWLAQA